MIITTLFCIRKNCNNEIPKNSKSVKYCSPHCARLFLKSEYQRKNKERIKEYNREYRKRGVRGNPSTVVSLAEFKERNIACSKCGTHENLQVCHVKPRWAGGTNLDNLILLCPTHHRQFDNLLRDFWSGV